MSRYRLVISADGTSEWVDVRVAPKNRLRKIDDGVHVSDMTFCCLPEEVAARRADDKLHGFHIEYKPDPTSMDPDGSANCMNAHIPRGELARYRRHHNVRDQNSKNGSRAMLTPEHLEQAARRIKERYPVKERA